MQMLKSTMCKYEINNIPMLSLSPGYRHPLSLYMCSSWFCIVLSIILVLYFNALLSSNPHIICIKSSHFASLQLSYTPEDKNIFDIQESGKAELYFFIGNQTCCRPVFPEIDVLNKRLKINVKNLTEEGRQKATQGLVFTGDFSFFLGRKCMCNGTVIFDS